MVPVQTLHADIPIPDELVSRIAAAVNLEGDTTLVWMPFFGFGPLHEFDSVNPGCDCRRVIHDACSQFVPLTVPPEQRP